MLLRSCLILTLLVAARPSAFASDVPELSSPTPANGSGAEPAVDKPVQEEATAPPFPEREELFQPPSVSRSAIHRQDSTEVALKGFIEVDKQRVVLSINGRMKHLAVGESSSGIEVIVIDPPKVTLQRGRVRWTETLFEIRAVPAPVSDESQDISASLSPEPQSDEAPPVQGEPQQPAPGEPSPQ